MIRDPESPRCVVCDARVSSGNSHCGGNACLRYEIRKEHIRKDQYDASDPTHFRLQSRGGAWRYYRRVEPLIVATDPASPGGDFRVTVTRQGDKITEVVIDPIADIIASTSEAKFPDGGE